MTFRMPLCIYAEFMHINRCWSSSHIADITDYAVEIALLNTVSVSER